MFIYLSMGRMFANYEQGQRFVNCLVLYPTYNKFYLFLGFREWHCALDIGISTERKFFYLIIKSWTETETETETESETETETETESDTDSETETDVLHQPICLFNGNNALL